MRIGIVGLGVVGRAIYKVIGLFHDEVRGYDIDAEKTRNTLDELFETDAIFLCLPTSLNDRSRLDTSTVTAYLTQLQMHSYQGLVIIKSTLPLNYLKTARRYDLRILYCPEFSHEKTVIEEVIRAAYVVMSGSEEDCSEYKKILYWIPAERFQAVDDRTAEMVKLAMNAFACTKVSFVNETERICRIQGADVEKVMEMLRLDGRCAPAYSYPNKGAYEGKCLGKDIQDLINSTRSTFLEAVEKVNIRTRLYYRRHG
jgi:nucleotide sugar dehydrogenase